MTMSAPLPVEIHIDTLAKWSNTSKDRLLAVLNEMDAAPDDEGRVHYTDMVRQQVWRHFGIDGPVELLLKLDEEMKSARANAATRPSKTIDSSAESRRPARKTLDSSKESGPTKPLPPSEAPAAATPGPQPVGANASPPATMGSNAPTERDLSAAPDAPSEQPAFAFVIGRSQFEGAEVFPDAQANVVAVQQWLMAEPGPNVPAENIFPPQGRDWTRAGAEELNSRFISLLTKAKKAPTPLRLYIYAAGPLLPTTTESEAFFICPDLSRPRHVGLRLGELATKAAGQGLFAEVLLLVDGVDVKVEDDLKWVFSPATSAEELLIERNAPSGRVFTCIARVPLAERPSARQPFESSPVREAFDRGSGSWTNIPA